MISAGPAVWESLPVITPAGPLEEGPAVGQATGVCRQVLGGQLEVAQLLSGLDLKDVEDELQCVPGSSGLYAAEGDQVLLSWAKLDEFDLQVHPKAFGILENCNRQLKCKSDLYARACET